MFLSYEQIQNLIRQDESAQVEFKEQFSKTTQKSLCAFANDFLHNNGGYILFGVSNNGTICGVNSDETQRQISQVAKECKPPLAPNLSAVNINGATVVVCRVDCSPNRPHFSDDRCWVRVGTETRAASRN